MDYIRRVDELLAPPPYWLGVDGAKSGFEMNVFTLDADPTKLVAILDDHLNKALQPPEYKATDEHGVSAGIRYSTASQRVLLSFMRYWRAESETDPATGWMSYSEVLIGFYVKRTLIDSDRPDEAFFYVATVNIDDSNYTGQLQDPQSLPIVLGREAYGMPKNPGQIFYRPIPENPRGAKLQVWDHPPGGGRFHLADAIVVDPDLPEGKRVDPAPPVEPPPLPERGMPADDPARWWLLANGLGLAPEEMRGRLRTPDERMRRRDRVPASARLLSMPEPWGDIELYVYTDLLYNAQLVGLKQFLDPTRPYLDGPGFGACYQAIVETPLEEDVKHLLPAPTLVGATHEIHFPEINRIDFLETFGIPAGANRRVSLEGGKIIYLHGRLLFAKPLRTKVWTPL